LKCKVNIIDSIEKALDKCPYLNIRFSVNLARIQGAIVIDIVPLELIIAIILKVMRKLNILMKN
jgi:hypothetical protein